MFPIDVGPTRDSNHLDTISPSNPSRTYQSDAEAMTESIQLDNHVTESKLGAVTVSSAVAPPSI